MENPWHEYLSRENKTKFHPKDEAHALAFNSTIKEQKKYQLIDYLEPSPYTGDPRAPVLMLLANPGASDPDEKNKIIFTGKKLELHKKNLLHQQENITDFTQRYESPADRSLESPYFKSITNRLIAATSVRTVATKIFFINFHGYQSKSFYRIPFTFHTQIYSFYLVKNAVLSGAHIIMGRNKTGWITAVPELDKYPNITRLRSQRSAHLSEKNLGSKEYKKLVQALD